MKIGLLDVDSHNFPNLPLMKISAYHKQKGDIVEFVNFLEHYDKVYVSKVFGDEYSKDALLSRSNLISFSHSVTETHSLSLYIVICHLVFSSIYAGHPYFSILVSVENMKAVQRPLQLFKHFSQFLVIGIIFIVKLLLS